MPACRLASIRAQGLPILCLLLGPLSLGAGGLLRPQLGLLAPPLGAARDRPEQGQQVRLFRRFLPITRLT